MLVNIGCYIGVSLIKGPNAAEHGQAIVFVDAFKPAAAAPGSHFWRGSASINDLLMLVGRFLGPERAHEAFAAYAGSRGVRSVEALSPTRTWYATPSRCSPAQSAALPPESWLPR